MKRRVALSLERGAGCQHAQLLRPADEIKPVEQVSQQVGDLAALRAAVHVQLVDHQREHAVVALQPRASELEQVARRAGAAA